LKGGRPLQGPLFPLIGITGLPHAQTHLLVFSFDAATSFLYIPFQYHDLDFTRSYFIFPPRAKRKLLDSFSHLWAYFTGLFSHRPYSFVMLALVFLSADAPALPPIRPYFGRSLPSLFDQWVVFSP